MVMAQKKIVKVQTGKMMVPVQKRVKLLYLCSKVEECASSVDKQDKVRDHFSSSE